MHGKLSSKNSVNISLHTTRAKALNYSVLQTKTNLKSNLIIRHLQQMRPINHDTAYYHPQSSNRFHRLPIQYMSHSRNEPISQSLNKQPPFHPISEPLSWRTTKKSHTQTETKISVASNKRDNNRQTWFDCDPFISGRDAVDVEILKDWGSLASSWCIPIGVDWEARRVNRILGINFTLNMRRPFSSRPFAHVSIDLNLGVEYLCSI